MPIFRNYKGGICGKGAIHELVIIMVFLNQVKTEIRVDQFYILTFEQQMNDDSLCRALSFSYQAWLYGVRRCSCRMASFFCCPTYPLPKDDPFRRRLGDKVGRGSNVEHEVGIVIGYVCHPLRVVQG